MTTEINFFENLKHEINCIKLDFDVYWSKRDKTSILQALLYMVTCHGWHIMFWFRTGRIIYHIKLPILSHLLKIIFELFWFILTTFYGIRINLISNIGPGFYIGHYGSIIIRGEFGNNCSVAQGVTVGSKGAGKSNGWPVFGNDVYIGAGAKVIGNIRIGNNVTIGANCVVLNDVPDDSLVVGVPGKFKTKGIN